MLKKIFITTCALIALMQSSFAGLITYVVNETERNIEFSTSIFHSCGGGNFDAAIKKRTRIDLRVEYMLQNPKVNKPSVARAPWKAIIDGKTYLVNWVGDNIENSVNGQYFGSSNSKGKGYTGVFKNIQENEDNDNNWFAGIIDMEFTPNSY